MSRNSATLDLFKKLNDNGVISDDAYQKLSDKIGKVLQRAKRKALSGEPDWESIREEWDFAHVQDGVIPMNAANLCPAPTKVVEAINMFRTEYNKDVSLQERTGAGAESFQAARFAIGEALGLEASPNDEGELDMVDLAIMRNCSEANNALSAGFHNWCDKEKDNIVIWKENHETNNNAWFLRGGSTESGGLFQIREVELTNEMSADEIKEAFSSQIDERTKFLTFTETSNSSGIRIPRNVISELFDQADALGCHVHIDGAQTWGAQSVNLNPNATGALALKCHSFSASSHKWLCGPKETGILYMHPDKAVNFTPSIFAYDYKVTIRPGFPPELDPNARRFELLGQRDDVNIIALLVAQDFFNSIGQKAIENRIAHLAEYLKNQLEASEWSITTPIEQDLSHGVVIVSLPDGCSEPEVSLNDFMYDQHRIAGSGTGGFRLCPHIYNLEEDIDRAVAGMNAWRDEFCS